jgi:hypothetical protein
MARELESHFFREFPNSVNATVSMNGFSASLQFKRSALEFLRSWSRDVPPIVALVCGPMPPRE